jgi:acyl carrier protein
MIDTLGRVTELIRDLFDEYEGPVTRDLTAAKVPQWDSLGHVQLMVLVEQTFGIRFNADQVGKFRNLGDLLDAIEAKGR